MILVGVDPGKDGGIVAIDIDGNIRGQWCIPTLKGSSDVDYPKLAAIFKQLKAINGFDTDIFVILEDVHSLYGMSAKSNFNFGHIKGVKEGMLAAFGYDYKLIRAKLWQQVVWSEEDVVTNSKGKRDPKKTSLKAAARIFPDVDFRKSSRSRKQHDGKVDAALMAEYCRIVKLGL
jgi:hypothetical protein